MNITVDVEVDLGRLDTRLNDPTPVYKAWANELYGRARNTFRTQTSPNGTPWADLTPRYAARKLAAVSRQPKGRKQRRRGAPKKGGNAKLVWTGQLEGSLFSQVQGDGVVVGLGYAVGSYSLGAIHQYGAPEANIPARPVLPVDDQGKLLPATAAELRQIAADYFG